MFSALIVAYLFLGGTGAGATIALCLLEFFDVQRHQGQRRRALVTMRGLRGVRADEGSRVAPRLPRNFYARAWTLTVTSLSLGVLCLLFDLGRPDRLFALLTNPELSAITVGSYSLVVTLCVTATFTGLSLFEGLDVPVFAVRMLCVVGVASGLVTVSYTGVLLQGMASVAFWQTPLLPVVFVLSSLSCGLACLFVTLAFTESRQSLVIPSRVFAVIDSVIIVLESLALAAFVASGMSAEGSRSSAEALLSGDLRWAFWCTLVIAGLTVPFVFERLSSPEGMRSKLLWTGGFILVGGLALRWCIVASAGYDVTQAVGSFLGFTVA